MTEFTSSPEKGDNSHSCPLPTLQISKDVCNGLDSRDVHALKDLALAESF